MTEENSIDKFQDNCISSIKKLLKYYRRRKTLLEKYRNLDLDKEILDCLNMIHKLRRKLDELDSRDKGG